MRISYVVREIRIHNENEVASRMLDSVLVRGSKTKLGGSVP